MFPLKDDNPTSRTPVVTIALIVANVLAYFLWQRGGLSVGTPELGGTTSATSPTGRSTRTS